VFLSPTAGYEINGKNKKQNVSIFELYLKV